MSLTKEYVEQQLTSFSVVGKLFSVDLNGHDEYGIIKYVHISNDNKEDKTLVVIPGYSLESFQTMFEIILANIDTVNYSNIYIFCWSSEIKEKSKAIIKGISSQEEQYVINERFREDLSAILQKIIKSMDLGTISLLGKSAGGGVAIYITMLNTDVNNLFLACPGILHHGKPLENRIDINIKLSWNRDDDKIPYTSAQDFINDFEAQEQEYAFYSYMTGGHELNPQFLKEL